MKTPLEMSIRNAVVWAQLRREESSSLLKEKTKTEDVLS